MMYSDKLVLAVKANGKILREKQDSVYVPFGTEYSLLIKNKNSVRASVSVEIDGADVAEHCTFIIPANGELDLERYIKGGNLKTGNKFKFIERTKKIEDGLVRVQFEFERAVVAPSLSSTYTLTRSHPIWPLDQWIVSRFPEQYHRPFPNVYGPVYGGVVDDTLGSVHTYTSATGALDQGIVQSNALPVPDIGITVPGSESLQEFNIGSSFCTDGVQHVLIMKMLGEVHGEQVSKPVTVQAKPKCITCGTVNKGNAKFCRECGTALKIF
jgi:hypothetical protein